MTRQEEQTLAAIAHAFNIVPVWGGVFAAWIWYQYRTRSFYLRDQARQCMAFHAAFLGAILVLGIAHLFGAVLGSIIWLLGAIFKTLNFFIFTFVWIAYVATCAYGAYQCWRGETFRYPLVKSFAE